jgi:preprotein translocase subunit SecD
LIILGVVIVALFGSVGIGVALNKDAESEGAAFVPKFALDLQGGTEMVLTPKTIDGGTVPADQIGQAIDIIRNRIDSSGVSEAEISNQGSQNIVVGIPGNPSQEDLALVTRSARMTFRTVLQVDQATPSQPSDWMSRTFDNPTATPSASASASASDSPSASASGEPVDPSATPSASASASPSASANPEIGPETGNLPVPPDAAYQERLTAAMDSTAILTDEVKAEATDLNCQVAGSAASGEVADADKPLVTCSQDGTAKYVLGPVMLEGAELTRASSGQQTTSQGNTTGQWAVNIEFNSAGAKQFGAVTTALYDKCKADSSSPLRQFAIVLDDLVISAPEVCNTAIVDGRAEISGSFTQASSKSLADQLSFGSLPINFQVESQQQVSASAGSEQLQKGLLAGLIGLILVALYSFVQYRALSFVTVLSLVFATGITYGTILVLSWVQNYRLSLAGVAGIIVSIGITADSFIVYFERIKDELRVGRTLRQAVDMAWLRARRTILASDGVNFLAAIVLYLVAVGGVRGFAFTLGLTTVMDLVVVLFFTHPVMLLLTKTKFWGSGHPWSGLDPHRLGAPGSVHYAGRGRISRVPDPATDPVPVAVSAGAASGKPKAATGAADVVPDDEPPAVSEVPKGAGSIAERKRAAQQAKTDGGEA